MIFKIRLLPTTLLFLIVVIQQSCITPIEYVNPNVEGTLAVFGQMSQEAGAKQIRLSRTTGFKNGIDYISDAKIVLYEDAAPVATP